MNLTLSIFSLETQHAKIELIPRERKKYTSDFNGGRDEEDENKKCRLRCRLVRDKAAGCRFFSADKNPNSKYPTWSADEEKNLRNEKLIFTLSFFTHTKNNNTAIHRTRTTI